MAGALGRYVGRVGMLAAMGVMLAFAVVFGAPSPALAEENQVGDVVFNQQQVRPDGAVPADVLGDPVLALGEGIPAESAASQLSNEENISLLSEDGVVAPGIYTLNPAFNLDYCIDAQGGNRDENTNIWLYHENGTFAQKFDVQPAGDGAYTLQSLLSGRYLTDTGGDARLRQGISGDRSQLWLVEPANDNGGVILKNLGTGNALDVANGSAVDENNIQTQSLSNSMAQIFQFMPVSIVAPNQAYEIAVAAGGTLVSVASGSHDDGANIQMWKGIGSPSQRWLLNSTGNGHFTITNLATRKNIDVDNTADANGANAQQMTPYGNDAQQFSVVPSGDGWFYLVNNNGGRLTVSSDNGENGVNLMTSTEDRGHWQKFRLFEASSSMPSGDPELDGIIADIINNITGTGEDALRKAYDYVAGFPYIRTYDEPYAGFTIPYAKEMYYHHGGNCYRYSSLFKWIAQGLGYQAEVRVGAVPSVSQGWAPHGWVEIYSNGKTYLSDPDMYHAYPTVNFYLFDYDSAPLDYRIYW